MLPRAKPRRGSGSSAADGSWSTVWERPVLFCDDAARIRELQVRMMLPDLGEVCARGAGVSRSCCMPSHSPSACVRKQALSCVRLAVEGCLLWSSAEADLSSAAR